jgi:hypothetical protein
MNRGSRIIDIRDATAVPVAESDPVITEMADVPGDRPGAFLSDAQSDTGPLRRSIWQIGDRIVASLAIIGWIAGMTALIGPQNFAGFSPVDKVQLIAALGVPPALVAIIWLLAARTNAGEVRRFTNVAFAVRAEAAALDRTIAALSRKIDANRDKLNEQTASLMAMGDQAVQRLTAISQGMAQEVKQADQQTRSLTEGITAAQTSLSVMLTSLPRALGEASDMRQSIEAIGLSASGQAAALDAQIAALTARGRESDDVVGQAALKLAAHIARMEATSETAGARLEQVTGDMSTKVDDLLGRTAHAVDEARKGIAAQGDAMLAMVEANQAHLLRASTESIEALADRISAIEAVVDRIGTRIAEQRDAGAALVSGIDTDFGKVESRIADFHSNGIERTRALAASIDTLNGSADAMAEKLRTGEGVARKAVTAAEDLLTSLDAAAREMDETMPEALARLDARIGLSRDVVMAAKPELYALVTAAVSTHDAIEAIAQVLTNQRGTLDELTGTLNEALTLGEERILALSAAMVETTTQTNDFAESAAPRLIEALMRVRETAATAADRARETLNTVIPEAAQSLEIASAQAMQRAVGSGVERHVADIIQATNAAVAATTRASEQLTGQMMAITETTALVESRIKDARAEREKAESDSFGRRASLLIESLNSASIDITKTFSQDVADSAWSAYLKGDRGVFTRRAVRLLDTSDAREIARLYKEDSEFCERVNRYIHDFEAMLRTILAQRDGSPMGVTLLSSDMGKLYVALAQAIERLRA